MAEIEHCPKCKSNDIRFRPKRQNWICDECDEVFVKEKNKTNSLNLFFSYGHDDNVKFVHFIKHALERRGHKIWIDSSEIKGGDDWRRKITQSIIKSSGTICFLSKYSVRYPGVCLDEIRISMSANNGNIKPILLEDEKSFKTPKDIMNIQWLDMSQWRNHYDEKVISTLDNQWLNQKINELCEVIENDDFALFSSEMEKIQKIFSVSIPKNKEQHLSQIDYHGRDWLSEDIERWRKMEKDSKVFVLCGLPGTGKSCFAVNLMYTNPFVLCGLLLEWDKEISIEPKNVIKILSLKIASKLPDYRSLLIERFEMLESEYLQKMSLPDIFDFLLIQPLSDLIDGDREPMIVILDGIDEIKESDSVFITLLNSALDKFPSWLKFLITGRPEDRISLIFKESIKYNITQNSKENINDIKAYLKNALSDYFINRNNAEFIISEIASKSQGSFLYISLFVESIKEGKMAINDFENFPDGLDSFYSLNFERVFINADYKSYRKIIEILLVAENMPIEIILEYLNISNYTLIEFKRRFGSLLIENTYDVNEKESVKSFGFSHKSIADWLSDYERSGGFYIDKQAGIENIGQYLLSSLTIKEYIYSEDIKDKTQFLLSYKQKNIINFLIKAKKWQDLEDFLIMPDTPLYPYWLCINKFPKDWNIDKLLSNLWKHGDKLDFFKKLQHRGETELILYIYNWYAVNSKIENLDIELFNIYVDTIHLSGNYRQAVSLYDNFLSKFKLSERLSNIHLLHFSIRRIHHSMFFSPVENLINEAQDIIKRIDPNDVPKEYNELLFLIGGNLGVLSGNFKRALPWIEESHAFSRKNKMLDFELRAVRKWCDILCYNNETEKSLALVSEYVNIDSDVNSRYEIYLLGTLGEIYRYKKDYENARRVYEKLLKSTKDRGLIGWEPHAYLAIAGLYFSTDNPSEALEYINKAEAIYNKIDHKWGMINSTMLRYLFYSDTLTDIDKKNINESLKLAKELNYSYNTQILEQILYRKQSNKYYLFFL